MLTLNFEQNIDDGEIHVRIHTDALSQSTQSKRGYIVLIDDGYIRSKSFIFALSISCSYDLHRH
jgi:hypothetical protein